MVTMHRVTANCEKQIGRRRLLQEVQLPHGTRHKWNTKGWMPECNGEGFHVWLVSDKRFTCSKFSACHYGSAVHKRNHIISGSRGGFRETPPLSEALRKETATEEQGSCFFLHLAMVAAVLYTSCITGASLPRWLSNQIWIMHTRVYTFTYNTRVSPLLRSRTRPLTGALKSMQIPL